MKKQVWLASILVLLVVAVMPVMAEGDNNRNRWLGNVFSVVGEVTAVDTTAKTITVKVHTGNKLVKGYIGDELTIQTGAKTLFMLYGETQCTPITFEDLVEAFESAVDPLYISANGKVVSYEDGTSAFIATRVTVDVPLHYKNANNS